MFLFSSFLVAASIAAPPVVEQPSLTLDGARRVIAAVVEEAESMHATGAIAIVDAGGALIAVERLDGTFPAASEISIGKARTAAMFRRPTRVFEEIITKGRLPMLALHDDRRDFTPLMGGTPIEVNGTIVGAIGVSGAASAQQDDDLASVGAKALMPESTMSDAAAAAPSDDVQFVAAADVSAAFVKGMPLLENGVFKIHASRRDGPGMAEVHTDEIDVIYVIGGGAEFVTGGEVVNGMPTAPHEIRGASIANGTARRISAGDVITVPAGVPHWFRAVDAGEPLRYYVVKIST